MLDVEVTGQAALEMIEHPARLPRRDAVVGHHDMGGDDRQRRGEGPGVQVVHGLDLGQLQEVSPNLIEIDVLRRRLEEHVDGGTEQLHRGLDHQEHDQE